MLILLLDNHDSFTFNLVQVLGALGAEVTLRQSDQLSLAELRAIDVDAALISPGPGRPEDAGISLEAVRVLGKRRIPLLGVCLGHQAICAAFGGRVIRAPRPMHGKTSSVWHDGRGVLRGLPSPFCAARYHSLAIDPAALPAALEVSARTDDGTIMAVRHRTLPIEGIQFHPESFLTEHGPRLLATFCELASGGTSKAPGAPPGQARASATLGGAMAQHTDHLGRILARKRVEIARRRRRAPWFRQPAGRPSAGADALRRRAGELPRVIAEIKHQSPSAGQIRPRVAGGVARLARDYEQGGASAVSVLCDGPGFGGTPLDVRRAAAVVRCPVLFKEFVLDEVQLDVARAVGATLVLLLVRALDDGELSDLIRASRARGLEPVVEAADAAELTRALGSEALIVGVNARDLRTFSVDSSAADELVARIPEDRIAVFMSGVRSADDLARVAAGRADAVLVGEGLMRAEKPGEQLATWLADLARRR